MQAIVIVKNGHRLYFQAVLERPNDTVSVMCSIHRREAQPLNTEQIAFLLPLLSETDFVRDDILVEDLPSDFARRPVRVLSNDNG